MNRLRELRKKNGLTQNQLCHKFNLVQNTLSNYETERHSIPDDLKVKFANFFNVSIDYLLGLNEENKIKKNKIAVLGTIPAGIPIEMIEDVIDYEDIPTEWLSGGREYFALKVQGDSMTPEYLDGDVVIVRKQDSCENGDECIVAVNGYDATFKKVIKKESGIILQPLNTNYEPMIYTNEDIEKLPVRILGVVVELRRTKRR